MRFTGKRVVASLMLVGLFAGCRRVRELEPYCNPEATRPEDGICFEGEVCCNNVCISIALSCGDAGTSDAGDAGGVSLADAAVFTISPDNGYEAIGASVGVDLAGRATVVWAQAVSSQGANMIWARRYSPDAGWADAGVLSLVAADSPQLAVSANGAGVIAWLQSQSSPSRVYAARIGVDGDASISGVETGTIPYDAGSSTNMRVVADAVGNLGVVWERDSRVYWNVSLDGGDWGTASEVSDDFPDASARAPFAAIHPTSGEVAVSFLRELNGIRSVFVRRTTLATSGWGQYPIRIDGEANASANSPRLGADDFGNVIAVWDQAQLGSQRRVWFNRFTPDAGWGDAGVVSDGNDRNESAEFAVDGDGGAVAVWRMDAGVIKWSGFSAGYAKPWSNPGSLGSPTASGSGARVAVARNGTGGVVWIEKVLNDFSVRLAPFSGANMGTTSQIAFGTGDATSPSIAINPSGVGGVVVWSAGSDGGIKRIYGVIP